MFRTFGWVIFTIYYFLLYVSYFWLGPIFKNNLIFLRTEEEVYHISKLIFQGVCFERKREKQTSQQYSRVLFSVSHMIVLQLLPLCLLIGPLVSFSLLDCCGVWSDQSFLRFSLLKNLGVGVAKSRRVQKSSAATLELLWTNSSLNLSFSFLFDRTILLYQTLDRHSHKIKESVLGKTQTNDTVHSEGITNNVFLLLGFEMPFVHF